MGFHWYVAVAVAVAVTVVLRVRQRVVAGADLVFAHVLFPRGSFLQPQTKHTRIHTIRRTCVCAVRPENFRTVPLLERLEGNKCFFKDGTTQEVCCCWRRRLLVLPVDHQT